MYQEQSKQPFCALTLYLNPTGNKSPKFEYKADAKSLFTCSLTKKKYAITNKRMVYDRGSSKPCQTRSYR